MFADVSKELKMEMRMMKMNAKRFDELDTNKDGNLTIAENEAAWSKVDTNGAFPVF